MVGVFTALPKSAADGLGFVGHIDRHTWLPGTCLVGRSSKGSSFEAELLVVNMVLLVVVLLITSLPYSGDSTLQLSQPRVQSTLQRPSVLKASVYLWANRFPGLSILPIGVHATGCRLCPHPRPLDCN
jgi:hypothetical protein